MSPPSIMGRSIDVAAAASISVAFAVAALWHATRRVSVLVSLTGRPGAYLVSVVLELVVALVFAWIAVRAWRQTGRRSLARRTVLVLMALLVLVAIGSRIPSVLRVQASERQHEALAVDWQLRRALRLTAAAQEDFHLRMGRYGTLTELTIAGGTVDPDVRLDVDSSPSGWRLVATSMRTGRRCVLARNQAERPSISREGTAGEPLCTADAAALAAVVPRAYNDTRVVRATTTRDSLGTWNQYRADPGKSGAKDAALGAVRWNAWAGGPLRATASFASGRLFTGTHGSGILSAYDAGTGTLLWRTQVPNWIHQDPIVAAGVVAVGFGDSHTRVGAGRVVEAGKGPGGISAHDATTGRRLWAAGESSAVMTSPVVFDERLVIYGTGFGELIARDLPSGDARWRRRLRGRVVMASPAIVDSVVVVAEEDRYACTYTATSGREIWCHEFSPSYAYVGHSSPTVAQGTAFFSGVTSGADLFGERSFADQLRYLRDRLLMRPLWGYAGQSLAAIDVASGRLNWMRHLGGGYPAFGHTSGTPVVVGDRVFVVAPIAQAVFAIDRRDGTILWKRAMASRLRGPPSFVSDHLLVGDLDGVLHALDPATGAERCRYDIGEGMDRAGPVIAGGTAFLGGVQGGIYARPVTELLAGCASAVTLSGAPTP